MDHLVWDVSPEIFSFGPLRVHWYGLLFALGFVLGHWIMSRIYRREGRPVENQSTFLLYVLLGTMIGARLGHVLFYDPGYYLARPWKIIMIWEGGLASHGGFIGVMVAIYLYVRKYREMSFLELADRAAIPSLLVAALIRVGNFFNSEILGTPSNAPWAIVFARVDNIPRHPVMLYESAAYSIVFCALYTAYWKTDIARFPGRMLGATLATAFLARFFLEFFKADQAPFEAGLPLNMGQLLSIPFIALGLYLIYRSAKTAPGQAVAAARKPAKKRRR